MPVPHPVTVEAAPGAGRIDFACHRVRLPIVACYGKKTRHAASLQSGLSSGDRERLQNFLIPVFGFRLCVPPVIGIAGIHRSRIYSRIHRRWLRRSEVERDRASPVQNCPGVHQPRHAGLNRRRDYDLYCQACRCLVRGVARSKDEDNDPDKRNDFNAGTFPHWQIPRGTRSRQGVTIIAAYAGVVTLVT